MTRPTRAARGLRNERLKPTAVLRDRSSVPARDGRLSGGLGRRACFASPCLGGQRREQLEIRLGRVVGGVDTNGVLECAKGALQISSRALLHGFRILEVEDAEQVGGLRAKLERPVATNELGQDRLRFGPQLE